MKRETVYGIIMLVCFITLVILAGAIDNVFLNCGIIK